MIFEVFAFFGIVAGMLVLAAELGKKPLFGLAAGIIVLILAFVVQAESIQFPTGTTELITGTDTTTGTNLQNASNSSGNFTLTTITLNEALAHGQNRTITTNYSNLPQFTSVMKTEDFLFIIFLVVGVYGILAYAGDTSMYLK